MFFGRINNKHMWMNVNYLKKKELLKFSYSIINVSRHVYENVY